MDDKVGERIVRLLDISSATESNTPYVGNEAKASYIHNIEYKEKEKL